PSDTMRIVNSASPLHMERGGNITTAGEHSLKNLQFPNMGMYHPLFGKGYARMVRLHTRSASRLQQKSFFAVLLATPRKVFARGNVRNGDFWPSDFRKRKYTASKIALNFWLHLLFQDKRWKGNIRGVK